MFRAGELTLRHRRIHTVLALGGFLGIFCGFAVQADADAVDPSLPKGHPQYTEVAPLPDYEPAIDLSTPYQSEPYWAGPPEAGPSQQVECDIDTNGSTSSDYVALILDRDAGDNLYIKVQQQGGGGKFSHIGFYHGKNAGGWARMTGGDAFFSIPTADEFESAHMTVIHDNAGNVTLRFTNIDGGGKVLVYSRGNWTPRNASGAGLGGWNGIYAIDNWGISFPGDTVCDNFNRPNAPTLGGNWLTIDGSASIVSNTARATGTGRSIFVGSCAAGVGQEVEADVSVVGSNDGYCALVLNYDGNDNLFVKVQQQTGGGEFDTLGFYHGQNGGGWPGISGGPSFITIPAAQRFRSAHMRVTVDAGGTVRLILTNIVPAMPDREYQRSGWTLLSGNGVGFGGWTSFNIVDNISIGGVGICDNFNRPDGPLGPNWDTNHGFAAIVSKTGRGGKPGGAFGDQSRSIFIGRCGECLDKTPPLVDITSPGALACACDKVDIVGSVSDPDGEYIGDTLQYRKSTAASWTIADSKTAPRSGVLYTWDTTLLAQGFYFVRVVGENECGLTASDTTFVYVSKSFGNLELRQPQDGDIDGGTVCVDGTAWTQSCFDHYTVMYKPTIGGVFAPVDPGFPTYTSTVINDPLASWNTAAGPTAVADGDYLVRLQGFDDCTNVETITHKITVDNTWPTADISDPPPCDYLSGVVPVIGTANDTNLRSWALMYTGGNASNWVTISSGNTPVVSGLLGNWNTVGLRPCAYTLRLTVIDDVNVSCSGDPHRSDYYVSVNVGCLGDLDGNGKVEAQDLTLLLANWFKVCP